MDVIKGIKYYINQMISRTGGGMKALLMDKETVSCQVLDLERSM